MKATVDLRNCAVTVSLLGAVLIQAGCAYRLYAAVPPSHGLIRVVADSPEQYSVEVSTRSVKQYEVPHDGRVAIDIPSYRFPCGVYLFDAIKVGGYSDPLKNWIVSVTRNGKTVRKQSLQAIQKSPTDEGGYHIVRIAK